MAARWLVIACGLVAMGLAGPTAAEVEPQRLDELRETLAHGDFARREQAAAEIVALGQPAIPVVLTLAEEANLELRFRSVSLLREMCLSVDESTWRAAQAGLEELTRSPHRLIATLAQDVVGSLTTSAEKRLQILGGSFTDNRTVLTLRKDWNGGGNGLLHLRWVPSIKTIRLENAALDADALTHLRWVPHLREVVIRDTDLDDRLFESLRPLKGLEILYLNGTKVTDRGCRALREHPNLVWLEVKRTSITDETLDVFSELEKLRSVDVSQTEVTAKGIQALRAKRPSLTVFSSFQQ